MSDFKMKGDKLVKYGGEAANVKIPEDVTEIGSEVFSNRYNLKKVTLPDSVTVIGKSAFNGSV